MRGRRGAAGPASPAPTPGTARTFRRRALVAAALTGVVVLTGCGTDAPSPEPPREPSTTATAPAPPTTAEAPARGAEPSIDPTEPLLTARTHEHSEVGGIVDGFPSDLLPVPPDAEVLVSSAVPLGTSDAVEVSLNLRTELSVDALMSLYRTSLVDAGFTEVVLDLVQQGLEAETTFTRSSGDEMLVIGVLDTDDTRTMTIGGRLRLSE